MARWRNRLRQLRILWSFVRISRLSARLYKVSFFRALSRTIWAFRVGGFDPSEALVNGVLDPRMNESAARRFVSKRELVRVQERVNPRHWYYVTEDKGIFYRFCEEAGIAVPTVHALLFRDRQSWSRDRGLLADLESIGRFFEDGAPTRMIIKPTRGVHGRSVWAVTRTSTGFSGPGDKSWSSGVDLARAVLSDPSFNAFVVQERVISHPKLQALTGSEALQSSRVVTYVDTSGTVHFLAASIRLISGKAIIDNIDWGRTGNFALQLHPQSGRPMDAMTFIHDGRVMSWIAPEEHPKLGEAMRSFVVPEWDRVIELLTHAAHKFLPIRTLGWDIAITPQGPMIVEANFRWDPMMHPSMRAAVDTIVADYPSLGARHRAHDDRGAPVEKIRVPAE